MPADVKIPTQLIVGHNQVFPVEILRITGNLIQEKAAQYSKEIDRLTRETFQRINCNDLYSLINSNKNGDPLFVYFGSVESLGTDFKHLQ